MNPESHTCISSRTLHQLFFSSILHIHAHQNLSTNSHVAIFIARPFSLNFTRVFELPDFPVFHVFSPSPFLISLIFTVGVEEVGKFFPVLLCSFPWTSHPVNRWQIIGANLKQITHLIKITNLINMRENFLSIFKMFDDEDIKREMQVVTLAHSKIPIIYFIFGCVGKLITLGSTCPDLPTKPSFSSHMPRPFSFFFFTIRGKKLSYDS